MSNPRAPEERNVLSKIGGYGITGGWMRRGWVSQPVGLGNQPTIARSNETSCANGKRTSAYLAPAGRQVYSNTGYTNILKPQRGDMCIEGRYSQSPRSSGAQCAVLCVENICHIKLSESGFSGWKDKQDQTGCVQEFMSDGVGIGEAA